MARGFKTGGRTQGSTNLVQNPIKTILIDILNKEIVNVETYLQGLEPKEKIDAIIKLLPFVLPKLAPEQMESQNELPARFEFDIEVLDRNENDEFVVTSTYNISKEKLNN